MNKIAAWCLLSLLVAISIALWKTRSERLSCYADLATLEKKIAAFSAANEGLRTKNSQLTAQMNILSNNISSHSSQKNADLFTATNSAQNAMEDVLEPRGEENSAKLDALKKRYEDMLVVYFMLRKCGKNKASDYHIIISALAQEMASINAPGRLQYDLMTSAEGSYQELYATFSCETSRVDPLAAQYNDFINSVAERFLPR